MCNLLSIFKLLCLCAIIYWGYLTYTLKLLNGIYVKLVEMFIKIVFLILEFKTFTSLLKPEFSLRRSLRAK